MAFVFEADRKVNQISKLVNPIGPGQYFTADNKNQTHSSAPFYSSSVRKTVFQQKQKEKPGPGDYEVSRPFIEPNIKSIANSHSIILKINSTGTSQFKSLNNRFKQDHSLSPGPGQYYVNNAHSKSQRKRSLSNISEEKDAIRKMKQLSKTFYQKKVPTIPNKYRGLTDTKKQQEVPQQQRRGPAFYNPNKTMFVNATGTVWGKDKTKRFIADKTLPIGPGQYKVDYNPIKPDQKANLNFGSFRSATTRTYFDSMIYRTNKDQTVQQRAKSIFKTKDPAPGQYDYNNSSFKIAQKPFSFQFFGSTVQRFTEDQPNTIKPKKNAFYNVKSQIGKLKSFNRGAQGFNSNTERKDQFLNVTHHEKIPGPGEYKQKVVVQKKLKGMKVQKFGSTTQRPFYKPESVDELGPGKYQKDENVQQFVKTRFGQINSENCTFKSSTARNCFGQIKNQTKLGEYDVSYYDVAKKLQRQKMFLQNLKKIQVQKPGFESSNKRFPHYQQQKLSPLKQKQKRLNINHENELKVRQQNQRARSVIISTNRQQISQNKINGYFDKQQRFGKFKKGTPGVGSYEKQQNWSKKTYNIKYQKQ